MPTATATSIVWDAHSCLPLLSGIDMGALRRHKQAGFDFVSINVGMDMNPIEQVMKTIAWFRHWLSQHPDGFQLAQVVKHSAKRHVIGVTRRVVHGTLAGIEAVLTATATGTVINTASIERLDATFRAHLAPLTRRGRAIARTAAALTADMWLVGTAYNFCWSHDSLRQCAPDDALPKWHQRTPAMAAGLADHPWTLSELLRFQIPLPRSAPPKRRGRPPKHPPLGAAA